ncbi:ABC transporter permease [Paenibacillus rhizovicinus]|uniref:ABC transporter permease n=1 Tax=Paenibacillus rhizovicinus TaxID=2704463 RepID=A0A6C0P1P0_9BACL|nr:ABC transporter permease [Paenibacillus rhizovicinus]QHW32385.1 ABC transporter permease [Paenibacillus rhizovicinus]
MRNKRTTFINLLIGQYGLFLLLLIALLSAWECSVRLGWIPFFILPAPTSIVHALGEDADLLFGRHLAATALESALGFLLSVCVGSLLAVGMHMYRTLNKALYPFVIVSQTIPLIALSPVFIMWFGYTIWSKIAVVFLTAFFPIVVSTYDGLGKGDAGYKELLLTMGARRWAIFRKIHVPLALPSFFSGLKLSVVYSVVGATIGEWLGGSEGLGYFSRRMSSSLKTDAMFASVFLLSALGIVFFLLIAFVEHLMLRKRRMDHT